MPNLWSNSCEINLRNHPAKNNTFATFTRLGRATGNPICFVFCVFSRVRWWKQWPWLWLKFEINFKFLSRERETETLKKLRAKEANEESGEGRRECGYGTLNRLYVRVSMSFCIQSSHPFTTRTHSHSRRYFRNKPLRNTSCMCKKVSEINGRIVFLAAKTCVEKRMLEDW